jgi:GT2 family glycosyltransferase
MSVSGFVDPASSGAAYRRSVFAEIGFYDERFDACEDVELNTRLRKNGMKAYTDPRLAVFYEPRATLPALIRQMTRYGRGRVRLMLKHRDCVSAAQIAPAILLAWIAAAIVSAIARYPASVWLRLFLFAPVCMYLAAAALSSFRLARKSGFRLLWQAPLIYGAIHLGLGAGMWAEAFHRAVGVLAGGPPLPAPDSAPGVPEY